jgi:hypothetical protein
MVAEKTLKATTQQAVRTVASPTVERSWPTGDRPLRYKRLHHQVFYDTMIVNVKSLSGNTCCKICNRFWMVKGLTNRKDCVSS